MKWLPVRLVGLLLLQVMMMMMMLTNVGRRETKERSMWLMRQRFWNSDLRWANKRARCVDNTHAQTRYMHRIRCAAHSLSPASSFTNGESVFEQCASPACPLFCYVYPGPLDRSWHLSQIWYCCKSERRRATNGYNNYATCRPKYW